jgi:hypothetical protein
MKKPFFLVLCASLPHGCFLLFDGQIYPYPLVFRNACNYDVEVTIPFVSQSGYQEYYPEAYLDSDGTPVVNLKPEASILFAGITAHSYSGTNSDIWQEFLPAGRTFTIKANNNSRTISKQETIELLKNNEAHPENDIPDGVIYDPSLCP